MPQVDVVIFGGGAAGLWLLDELTRAGRGALLLEANDLGSGQTIASQGIIHGGLKYTLSGLLTPSARAIAAMPLEWRRCLAGEGGRGAPDLSGTRMRAHYCHVWRTDSLRSKLAMVGARAGLRITPVEIPPDERPAALARCPAVARLDEQVIEPASLLNVLHEPNKARVLKIDAASGLEIVAARGRRGASGHVELIRLLNPDTGEPLDLQPRHVVLCAGEGNAALRTAAGLDPARMQRRPLHMVMLRARVGLPVLNGHCVDGSATRATITTTRDFSDKIVWQIGGQIAERGVALEPRPLIDFARGELRAILPGLDFDGMEWATYRVNRAEAATWGGRALARPNEVFSAREGNTITAWPTKLALAPELARRVIKLLAAPAKSKRSDVGREGDAHSRPSPPDTRHLTPDTAAPLPSLRNWPRAIVALPPWETAQEWIEDS